MSDVKSNKSDQRMNIPSSGSDNQDPLDLDVTSDVEEMALEIFDNVFKDIYD